MPVDKFKKGGVLTKGVTVKQSFNFLRGFGNAIDIKDYKVRPPSRDTEDEGDYIEGIVRSVKKIADGVIVQKYYPGNESDQYRVYISLARRAQKDEEGRWVAQYLSYRSMAVEAFGTEDPSDDQIKRVEYALNDLSIRSIDFRRSFKVRDKKGNWKDSRKRMFLNIIHEIINNDESVSAIKVAMPDSLMSHHLGDLTMDFNFEMLISFKNDQFTRQLYQYLISFFHARKITKLHPRTYETFMREFGIWNTNHFYTDQTQLKAKLKISVDKINKSLEKIKAGYIFMVQFNEDGKITFYKMTPEKTTKRVRTKL